MSRFHAKTCRVIGQNKPPESEKESLKKDLSAPFRQPSSRTPADFAQDILSIYI